MKILVIAARNKTVFNFRGDLIKDMITHGNEVYVTGPNQEYVDDILALGVSELIEVPLVKDNTSIKGDLKYLTHLCKTVKRVSPDIVFSYNIKPVVYGSFASRVAKVQHIFAMVTGMGRVYTSNSPKAKALRVITKTLYKNAFRSCEKVIFQNRDDIHEMVSSGCLPELKTAVVNGSGVNMQRFIKSPLPESPVFLMVGRIIREKGVLEFCEAARQLKKTRPQAKCILLGGFDSSIGALKSDDIETYICDGSVEHYEEVKDPIEFYSNCSVFVLPSYYREGLPRTILEAMSCGRPVITTDWTGCREPIKDGINGFLVPIKDSKSLAEKMEILCDYETACAMGEEAYQTCLEKYDVNIVNSQMRQIIGY